MSSPPVCEPVWWREPRARALATWGVVLVASGLAHVAVWGALGGPWEGAVSWRKPILFGISGGLTSLSLAWVWSKLPWRRGDAVLARLTAAALVVEVALIDLQRWRGVASHFNRTTPLDSILYDAMGILILFVSAIAVDLCIRLFLQGVDLEPDARLAARAGMLFLVVSCALGIWVSVHGDVRVAAGLEPERYGAAGVPKFPHGSVIHALQWLPVLAWGAARAGMSPRRRRQIVTLATAGTLLVLVYSLIQTFSGRSRTDAEPASAAILAAGAILLAVPAAAVAAGWIASRTATRCA